ncbi:MAG: hypothetical protein ACKOTA_11945, partial [Solirubrobacterales bacterium]
RVYDRGQPREADRRYSMGEADNNPSPLEARLEELLGQELFEPPADFVAAAQINSPDIYAEAEASGSAWTPAPP